jgi:hypothetical protein
MKPLSGELEPAYALDALEPAEAQIALRMRNSDDRGITLVLEMVMVALDSNKRPTSCVELTDDVARALH